MILALAHASSSGKLSGAAIAAAVIAALIALGCLAWGIARVSAFEPRWTLSLRHAVAEAGETLAHERLGLAAAVFPAIVEERDARVDGLMHKTDGSLLVGRVAEVVAAEAEGRDGDVVVAAERPLRDCGLRHVGCALQSWDRGGHSRRDDKSSDVRRFPVRWRSRTADEGTSQRHEVVMARRDVGTIGGEAKIAK